ncbi:hypothetical protein AVEN_253172-1 [Araneus ventricosus]|uniref:Uncharacterized protein n=1 Tax=Araneus ventricosus TaxID=182803 RepID=A0A4Y2HR37_ARAVE|nr:hypothetical protein AVEN_253172-1 [Araneus ventricosus]
MFHFATLPPIRPSKIYPRIALTCSLSVVAVNTNLDIKAFSLAVLRQASALRSQTISDPQVVNHFQRSLSEMTTWGGDPVRSLRMSPAASCDHAQQAWSVVSACLLRVTIHPDLQNARI